MVGKYIPLSRGCNGFFKSPLGFTGLGIVKEAMDMEPSMVVEGGQSWWYLGTTNHPTPTYSCHERSMKTLSVSGQRAVKQNRCPVCFFLLGFHPECKLLPVDIA